MTVQTGRFQYPQSGISPLQLVNLCEQLLADPGFSTLSRVLVLCNVDEALPVLVEYRRFSTLSRVLVLCNGWRRRCATSRVSTVSVPSVGY